MLKLLSLCCNFYSTALWAILDLCSLCMCENYVLKLHMNSNVGGFEHVYVFVITSPACENPTDLHILNVLLVDCSLSHHIHTSTEVHSMATTLCLHRSRKACRINTALTDMSMHNEKIISTLHLLAVPYNPLGGHDGCKAGADGFGSSVETA